jgi:hypothetical protein
MISPAEYEHAHYAAIDTTRETHMTAAENP